MNDALSLVLKHRRTGAILDANLLLVYVIGISHPGRLSHFQHTKQYEPDLPLIKGLVAFFSTIYTTPNVLTEVSNLGRKLGADFFGVLRSIVAVLDERYCVSRDACANEHFHTLGLTDAGLCIVGLKHLVITTDFPLYQILTANNIDAVNFHHLRPIGWEGILP